MFESNADRLAAELQAEARQAVAKARTVVARYGQLVLTQVQANASGRPGPRAITGDYRRSWGLEVRTEGGKVTGEVGTNEPQARRLEMGFVGTDSLHREYHQPPYPHAGPALDRYETSFDQAAAEVAGP